MWAEPFGELKRLIWLEQRLLWGLRQGPGRREPRGGPSWNSRLGVGVAVWAVILCVSLNGEMSGSWGGGGGTGLRKMSPASLEKEMGSLSAVTHALPGISMDSPQSRNR